MRRRLAKRFPAATGVAMAVFLVCLSAAAQAPAPDPARDGGDGDGAPTPAAPGPAPAAVDDAAAAEHPESYLDFALAGGYLMVPIGLLSLLWMTFLVERLVVTRRSRVLPISLARQVAGLPAGGDLDRSRLEAICSSHPSSAARVLKGASDRLDEPLAEIEHGVNVVAQREIHWLRRYIGVFAVIAAVAPLLGLLGTVTGMIQAFREVAIQGLGSGQALAPGIYKALVTTAAGLMVAIPALVTYHWFVSRIDNYVHAVDQLVVDFVEAHRMRRGAAGRRPLEGVAATEVGEA